MIVAARPPRVILLFLVPALSLVLALAAEGGTAFAAEFTVNSTADSTATTCTSTCTLRAAIAEADKSADPSSTIIVPSGTYELSLAESGDPQHTGELRITNPPGTTLTIKGAGVGVTVIDASAAHDRGLQISGGGSDVLEGLTLEKGFQHEDEPFNQEDDRGAGIRQTMGELTLDHVRLTANIDNGYGGGIDVQENGALKVIDSEIDNNVGNNGGGGGVDLEPGTIEASGSTFYNDTSGSGEGGGVRLFNSTGSFINDTFASDGFNGSELTYEGGAAYLEKSSVSFTNVTFAGDLAGGNFGGGSDISANEGSHLELTNVLLGPRPEEEAGQQDCTNGTLPSDAKSTWVDLGGNLSADGSCELNAADMGRELKLGELGAYGGPTETVPLLEGSPAINFGVPGCPETDQRGYGRVGNCDSGAFEFGGIAPKTSESGGSPGGSSGSQPGTSGTAGTTTSSTTSTGGTVEPVSGVASTPKAIEELRLGCTNTQLVLNDVYIHGGRVLLSGSAASSLVGKKVKILFNEGKQVATATVEADGQYTTTAPLPPAKIRDNLSTRYTAEVGKLRSVHLKLVRRLLLEPPKASGTTVTLTGQVTLPLTKPITPVVVEQQLECGKTTVATTFTPPANGRFDITLTVPANAKAAIFRLTSKVAANKHSVTHGFTTFSLPLPVALG